MMLKLTSLAAVAAFAALPLAAQAQPSNTCFHTSDIQSSKVQRDDRGVLLRLSTGAYYRIGFAADCPNPAAEPLIVHPTDNSGIVCNAIGIDIRVRGGGACMPNSLTRLSPAEVAAIPPADRP